MDSQNPFERYGIKHLSPSSLSLYRNSPALRCLRYLFGIKDHANSYAWRGRAVETAVDSILLENAPDDVAVERAKHTFELSAQGEITPNIEKERRALPDLVRQAAPVFRRLGRPLGRQRKIEFWVDGIEVPIIGYCDYEYPEFIVDLKTGFPLPSKPKPDDCVQVVLYGDALGKRPGLVYTTPRKVARYPHTEINAEAARRVLRQSAHAVRNMLAATGDKEHAAALFVPNLDDFRSTEITRDAAERVWI
jgi:hypothetical protein